MELVAPRTHYRGKCNVPKNCTATASTNPCGGALRGSGFFLHLQVGFYCRWRVGSETQLRSVESEIRERNSGRGKAVAVVS
ncbi:hypothetical protein DM860_010220 [Cuscuta australis]|uniref:Uncharacterized protein n=1 Tax=Cuscuta australis TaxID=267555 RepID=A0A328D7A8_9ASTE|nr:hypothetical protein DM860_010220 [Cuscuta australis]